MALTRGVSNVTLDERRSADIFFDAAEAANNHKASSSTSSSTATERMLVALGKGNKPAYHADKETGTLYMITAQPVGDVGSPDKESSRIKYA